MNCLPRRSRDGRAVINIEFLNPEPVALVLIELSRRLRQNGARKTRPASMRSAVEYDINFHFALPFLVKGLIESFRYVNKYYEKIAG
jgi:hypothetical protein